VSVLSSLSAQAFYYQDWRAWPKLPRTAEDDEDHSWHCVPDPVDPAAKRRREQTALRAGNLFVDGHPEEAIAEYSKLIKEHHEEDTLSAAYQSRGEIYYSLGQLEKAYEDISKAPYSQVMCARLALKIGKYKDAIAIANEQLEKTKAAPWYGWYEVRAEANLGLKRDKDALSDFEEAARRGNESNSISLPDDIKRASEIIAKDKFGKPLNIADYKPAETGATEVNALLQYLISNREAIDPHAIEQFTGAHFRIARDGKNWQYNAGNSHRQADVRSFSVQDAQPRSGAQLQVSIDAPISESNILAHQRSHDSVRKENDEFKGLSEIVTWKVPGGTVQIECEDWGWKRLRTVEFIGTGVHPYTPASSDQYLIAAEGASAGKNFELSIRLARKCLALNPNKASAHREIAQDYLELKKFDLAVSELSAALKKQPFNYDLYWLRGQAYRKHKHYDSAIKDMKKSMKEPNTEYRHEILAATLAATLIDAKRYDAALQTLSPIILLALKELQANPAKAFPVPIGNALQMKSNANWMLGNKKAAIEDMKKAAKSFYEEARIIRRDWAIRDLRRMQNGLAPLTLHEEIFASLANSTGTPAKIHPAGFQ